MLNDLEKPADTLAALLIVSVGLKEIVAARHPAVLPAGKALCRLVPHLIGQLLEHEDADALLEEAYAIVNAELAPLGIQIKDRAKHEAEVAVMTDEILDRIRKGGH